MHGNFYKVLQAVTLLGAVTLITIASAAKPRVVKIGMAFHQKLERLNQGARCCLRVAMSVSNCSTDMPSLHCIMRAWSSTYDGCLQRSRVAGLVRLPGGATANPVPLPGVCTAAFNIKLDQAGTLHLAVFLTQRKQVQVICI